MLTRHYSLKKNPISTTWEKETRKEARVSNCNGHSKNKQGGIPLEIFKVINWKQVSILRKGGKASFYKQPSKSLHIPFLSDSLLWHSMTNTKRKGFQAKSILGAGLSAFLPISLQTHTPFTPSPPLTNPPSLPPFQAPIPSKPHLSYASSASLHNWMDYYAWANFRLTGLATWRTTLSSHERRSCTAQVGTWYLRCSTVLGLGRKIKKKKPKILNI